MKSKSSITPPSSSFVQIVRVVDSDGQLGPEMELWEPPFERWMRLADDLLRGESMERCQHGRDLPPS